MEGILDFFEDDVAIDIASANTLGNKPEWPREGDPRASTNFWSHRYIWEL